MLKRIVITSGLGLLAGLSFNIEAKAQVVVIGNSDAQSCYRSALTDMDGRRNSIRHCETALNSNSLNPKDRAATYVNQGILQMRGGAYDDAMEAYDRALKIKPSLPEAHINRGACLIYLGRAEEAIPVLTSAIEADNEHKVDALYNRGIAYNRLGQVKAAYLDFKKSLELRPDWPPAIDALTRFEVVRKPSN